MQYLRQSTAATVLVGPVLDADGAAVTGAVIGDFRLSKNGTVATMAGNTIAHDHNGMYRITLTTANTDTVDRLMISMGNTAYGMTAFRYTVLTDAQYDALIANGTITPAAIEAALVNEGDATALLQAIADKIAGDLTAGDLTALAIVSAIKADATLAQMISRIDVATSTRLASGSYTAPPTAATVASAVWNAATVDHTSTGSFGWVIGLLFSLIENVSGWRFTSKAMERAAAGLSGVGIRAITVTVTDGNVPLQNAGVQLSEGTNSYIRYTNASGQATFNLNDATYDVAIAKSGYDFSGDELIVNAATNPPTFEMNVLAILPSSPGFVTGYWVVRSVNGTPYAGVAVLVRAVRPVVGATGTIHVGENRSATTDANGVASFTNMLPGWMYRVTIDNVVSAEVTVPPAATGTVSLGSAVLPSV